MQEEACRAKEVKLEPILTLLPAPTQVTVPTALGREVAHSLDHVDTSSPMFPPYPCSPALLPVSEKKASSAAPLPVLPMTQQHVHDHCGAACPLPEHARANGFTLVKLW